MFIINCPYCGERDQQEFKAGGEAHIERPKQPTELSDDEWAEYLFMRKNIKGVQFERWNHAHGCRKWFNMVRDTSNDEIKLIYKIVEKNVGEKIVYEKVEVPKEVIRKELVYVPLPTDDEELIKKGPIKATDYDKKK